MYILIGADDSILESCVVILWRYLEAMCYERIHFLWRDISVENTKSVTGVKTDINTCGASSSSCPRLKRWGHPDWPHFLCGFCAVWPESRDWLMVAHCGKWAFEQKRKPGHSRFWVCLVTSSGEHLLLRVFMGKGTISLDHNIGWEKP